MTRCPFDLSGRLALVVGATRGIGRGIAEGLAAAGADVIGTGIRVESLDGVKAAVVGCGRAFFGYPLNLDDPVAVGELPGLLARDGRVPDILVSSAGVIDRTPATDHSDERWDRVLRVDLTSHFRLAREFGRAMIERGSGKIIFVCSLLSLQGGINVPSYAAAKSGLLGLTRELANEWAPRGVNVNALIPGYIATDTTTALRQDGARNKAIVDRIPAGRWGTGADLAGAAVFLASDAAAYVHGTAITVDGGWMGR